MILFDKLSCNERIIIENVTAQMLVNSDKNLYFFSINDKKH